MQEPRTYNAKIHKHKRILTVFTGSTENRDGVLGGESVEKQLSQFPIE